MSHRLPEKGLWHVAGLRGADETPFDLIKLDLRGGSGPAFGTVRARNLETPLRRVRLTGPDRFVAAYDVRGHRGEIAGAVRPDGSLKVSLTGTVTASFVACAADADVAGPDAPDWLPADALRALTGAVDAICRPAGMATSGMARGVAA